MNNNTGNPLNKNDSDEARTMARVGSATLRVERQTREGYNFTPPAQSGPHHYTPTKMMVARVTGDLSPGNGLHPAKLYYLDSAPQLNVPPDDIVWEEVVPDENTGSFAIKPQPDQTLGIGDQGIALLAGVLGDTTIYTITGGTVSLGSDCLKKIVGVKTTDCFDFEVQTGADRCANITGTLLKARYSATSDKWFSTGVFQTAYGDTRLRLEFAADDGDPVVFATTGEGGSGSSAEKPLRFLRCINGWSEFIGRPSPWCDSVPVTTCTMAPAGAPQRYRVSIAGGTSEFNAFNGVWDSLYASGCAWSITKGTVTCLVQWVNTSGSLRQFSVTMTDSGTGAGATWLGTIESSTEKTGCEGLTLLTLDSSTGTGTVPSTPEVGALGPCVDLPCAGAVLTVRVRCASCAPPTGCQLCSMVGKTMTFTAFYDSHVFDSAVVELVDGVPLAKVKPNPSFGLFGALLGWVKCDVDGNFYFGDNPSGVDGYPTESTIWTLATSTTLIPAGTPTRVVGYFQALYPGDSSTPGDPADADFYASVECESPLDPADDNYDCVGGACVPTPGGPYTEATCGGNCTPYVPPPEGCCTGAGEQFEGGVYPNLFSAGAGPISPQVTFIRDPSGFYSGYSGTDYWSVGCSLDTWLLFRNASGIGTGPFAATAVVCTSGSFSLTFDGTAFGYGSDIVIGLTP